MAELALLNPNTVESSELVQETFEFWLKDDNHIRCPFPNYIHNELKQVATERFYQWASKIKDSSKEEMNDEMIGEKFEEIIFDVGTQLVKTEDEKITILYPFLPRVDDEIKDENSKVGHIVDREISKVGDKSFLKVKLKRDDNSTWETSFELPL